MLPLIPLIVPNGATWSDGIEKRYRFARCQRDEQQRYRGQNKEVYKLWCLHFDHIQGYGQRYRAIFRSLAERPPGNLSNLIDLDGCIAILRVRESSKVINKTVICCRRAPQGWLKRSKWTLARQERIGRFSDERTDRYLGACTEISLYATTISMGLRDTIKNVFNGIQDPDYVWYIR